MGRGARSIALVCAAALGAACGGASASPPGGPSGAHAARVAKAGRATTRSTRYTVPAGVSVQRLTPPGPAFRPTCPARTLIGTVTAPAVTARTRPQTQAPAIATFRRRNEQGSQQVFDLLGEVTGPGGSSWYQALLPLRPNDTLGYVPANHLRATGTDY